MITVYTITWNERFLLPYFFDHYNFADKIIVYDNGSTDDTQDLVKSLGGVLRHYQTNGQDNQVMMELKNNCWKGDKSDWVIVCDVDEFLHGTEILKDYSGKIVFHPQGYQMVGEGQDLKEIRKGFKEDAFSKMVCFSPKIDEINFNHGCHKAEPKGGTIVRAMNLLHYNFLSEEYFVNRRKRYIPRMSRSDIAHKWGGEYLEPEEYQRSMYRAYLKIAVDLGEIL